MLPMTTVTIVIQNSPYKENNKAWHALRFAGAALAEDMAVYVHLLDDGVEVGRHSHRVPEGAVNLEELPSELIECGLEVPGMTGNKRTNGSQIATIGTGLTMVEGGSCAPGRNPLHSAHRNKPHAGRES